MLRRLLTCSFFSTLSPCLRPQPCGPTAAAWTSTVATKTASTAGTIVTEARSKGAMFDSQAEMLQALETPSRSPTKPDQPAPHVVREFTGRVVSVSDGNTIAVLHSGKPERIRLHGIDSPEKRQAFGKRAKQFTSRLTYGKRSRSMSGIVTDAPSLT